MLDRLPAQIRAIKGVGPTAVITGVPDLATIAKALTTVSTPNGSITANLDTGAVRIDVARVLSGAGLDLNKLPPNTLLMPYITAALTSQLLPAITPALSDLSTQITAAINGIGVTVAGVPIDPAVYASVLDPVIAQVTAPVTAAAATVGTKITTPVAAGLSGLVSLKANVQSTAAGSFTERALQVGVIPADQLAQVNLASSTVGPNAGPAVAVPTASGIVPDHGPQAGGTSVTITGTKFVPGKTSVTIGGIVVPAAEVTVDKAGATATFTNPAHAPRAVDATVTTPGGTTPPLTYTYDSPAGPQPPVITSLADGSTGVSATPSIIGTGQPGSTVTVTEDARPRRRKVNSAGGASGVAGRPPGRFAPVGRDC